MNDRMFGRVIEIFLPEDNGKIGFKVKVDDEIITIVEEQNEDNSNIFRYDFVFVNRKILGNEEVFEIEEFGDVEDE